MAARSINRPMLQAAIALKKKGKSLYAAHPMFCLIHQSPWETEGRIQLSMSQGHRSDTLLKQAPRNQLYYMRKPVLLGSLGKRYNFI